uniref:Uncharacterized protein n=1 Tax=Physcomitrium patens TaxID=3218 RepID=A0A2K1KBV7_PHYPA|nr:hypothetical protein PHYPA_010452 [Physcomitrium patens]
MTDSRSSSLTNSVAEYDEKVAMNIVHLRCLSTKLKMNDEQSTLLQSNNPNCI